MSSPVLLCSIKHFFSYKKLYFLLYSKLKD